MNDNYVMVKRDKRTLDMAVTEYLLERNFKRNGRGFGYLREAIKISYSDTKVIIGAMEIYKKVSVLYGTSNSKIERCIRHAIEKAVPHTNSGEFIRSAADDIRLNYREIAKCPPAWDNSKVLKGGENHGEKR